MESFIIDLMVELHKVFGGTIERWRINDGGRLKFSHKEVGFTLYYNVEKDKCWIELYSDDNFILIEDTPVALVAEDVGDLIRALVSDYFDERIGIDLKRETFCLQFNEDGKEFICMVGDEDKIRQARENAKNAKDKFTIHQIL